MNVHLFYPRPTRHGRTEALREEDAEMQIRSYRSGMAMLAVAGALFVAPRADAGLTDWLKEIRARLPLADVNHKYILNPPKVNDPKIGKSHAFPIALKIRV